MKIVKQGQSFLDKVTQLTGSYENALEMAFLNNRSITDDGSQYGRTTQNRDLTIIGLELKVSKITNKRVVNFFNTKNEPATAVAPNTQFDTDEDLGIGDMAIGSTFIIR